MSDQIWTDKLLDALRQQGDTLADDVVARYFKENEDQKPRQLMRRLVEFPVVRDETRSCSVDSYHLDLPQLPVWADHDRMSGGAKVFQEYGLLFGTSLFCASLPQSYAARKGVQVLHMTTRLASDTQRRIYETAQMVIDVMTPGYLEPGQPGYYEARQVRLMHAAIRHLIQNDSVVARNEANARGIRWMDEWGVPINQEDLLGTLMTFTVVNFESLRRFGVTLSDQETDDFLHTWNVVGYLLGIREDLLPIGLESANELWAAIKRRQWRKSQEGAEMTAALTRLLRSQMPPQLRRLPNSLIRYLSGDNVGDMLQVGQGGCMEKMFFGQMQRFMAAFLMAKGHCWISRQLSVQMGRALFQGFLLAERGESRASFSIPDHLADKWRVKRAA